MYVTLGIFLSLLIPRVFFVFAKPVVPSDNLSASTTRDVSAHSQALKVNESNFEVICVSPAEQPNWAGTINTADCKAALFQLDAEVSGYGAREFTFWSESYVRSPPLSGWELPYGKSSGTLFFQMLFTPHSI